MRRDGSPEPDERPADPVDLLDGGLVRGAEHFVLQSLELIREPVQDRKVGVDDRVQQGVGQVVRLRASDPQPPRPDALADALEHISGPFLDRQNPPRPEEDRYLFGGRRLRGRHMRDDEEIFVVRLHLGALAEVDHVLHRQHVELEDLSELAEHLALADTIHVDPDHRPLTELGADLLRVLDLPLQQILRRVGDQPNRRPRGVGIEAERSRRGTGSRIGAGIEVSGAPPAPCLAILLHDLS